MIGVASAVFLYYSTWVLVLPFVDESNSLHGFFLPRDYAIKIPVLLLLIGGIAVGSFIASVLLKEHKKKQLKNSKKSD